jgi:hypothetical protein
MGHLLLRRLHIQADHVIVRGERLDDFRADQSGAAGHQHNRLGTRLGLYLRFSARAIGFLSGIR